MPIQYGGGSGTSGDAETLVGHTPSVTPAPGVIPIAQADSKLATGFLPEGTVYVHPDTHPASMIVPDTTHRFVTDDEKTAWNAKQAALGFTPENPANKGVANGYAGLNADGIVPLTQLPSSIKECAVAATIAARDAIAAPFTGLHVLVLDATADTTVEAGGAEYVWNGTTWSKIAELNMIDTVQDWSNLQNKPSSTPAQIDAAVSGTHAHTNKTAIDLIGNSGGAPTWNGGDWPAPAAPSIWEDSGATATSATPGVFTVTDNADNQALFKPGRPLKFMASGETTKYAIITGYTTGSVTFAGAALTGASVTYAVYTADFSRVCQVDFRILDKFSAATANTGLLASKAFTSFEWEKGPAYLVCVRHKVITADTGANQPRVNMSIASNKVVTTNSSAGQAVSTSLSNSGIDINETYYKILFGQSVELTCDANATNNNAANLKVTGIFILE